MFAGSYRHVRCNNSGGSTRRPQNIVAYIAKENPSAAETLGRELLDEAMSLESLPYRGSPVKKRRGLLKLIHGNYLVYYRIQEQKNVIEIVAFKHGAQLR